MRVQTLEYLKKINRLYITVDYHYTTKLQSEILIKHESIETFNVQEFGMARQSFAWGFKHSRFSLQVYLKMHSLLGIKQRIALSKITGYYLWGSRSKPHQIPSEIHIDEYFCEGYGLYLAEGDTGMNGHHHPNKVRFTNNDHSTLLFYLSWITTLFPDTKIRSSCILPENTLTGRDLLSLPNMKLVKGKYNKKPKYRIAIDSKIHIDLLLRLRTDVEDTVHTNISCAKAWVRGLFAGEGTVYNKKSKYVRIEMRNESIIQTISNVFDRMNLKHRMYERSDRPGMWAIYIGVQSGLEQFRKEIGFGCHQGRQQILDSIVV